MPTFSFRVDDDRRQAIERVMERHLIAWSPTGIADLLRGQHVRIKGKVAKAGRKLWHGDEVTIDFPAPKAVPPTRGDAIRVLHDDARVLVIDKPTDLTVDEDKPGPRLRAPTGTTVVTLLGNQRHDLSVGGFAAPGVAHRLDADTTGCLALAKTDAGLTWLSEAFENKLIAKHYLVLIEGHVEDSGSIETPYGKDPADPRKYSSKVASAREARLSYVTEARFEHASLLRVRLETGRTHQIRVQFADLGHPVVGDLIYGQRSKLIRRQALHAHTLALEGEDGFSVTAPLPADFDEARTALSNGATPRAR